MRTQAFPTISDEKTGQMSRRGASECGCPGGFVPCGSVGLGRGSEIGLAVITKPFVPLTSKGLRPTRYASKPTRYDDEPVSAGCTLIREVLDDDWICRNLTLRQALTSGRLTGISALCPSDGQPVNKPVREGLPTNWTRFRDRPVRRPSNGGAAQCTPPSRWPRGLMRGAGFLALRVQVDAAEESGNRVRA